MISPPDGFLRIAVIAFGAAIIREAIRWLWNRSKGRRSEIPMKERKGVHVPWGWHERVVHWAGNVGALWFAFILSFLIYLILTGQ